MATQEITEAPCVFCSIIAGTAPATVVARWDDAIAILPLSPVVEGGHILIIPRTHVPDMGTDPAVSAATMARAAELAAGLPAANVITSKGAAATQTVAHLHLHVVTRQFEDRLCLPWTPQLAEAHLAARAA
jgi:histidine triad (HIT) family protein